MPKQYSIAQAKDNLPGIVHEAEAGSEVELTRRGQPVAVIVSVDQYRQLSGRKSNFWEEVTKFREETDLVALAVGPEYFESLRDRSPGRADWGS